MCDQHSPYYDEWMETLAAAPSVIEPNSNIYSRITRAIRSCCIAEGLLRYDTAGKRYLDLIAGIGVNALGYAHPRLTKVIREQAALLLHTSNLYYHEYQGPSRSALRKPAGSDACSSRILARNQWKARSRWRARMGGRSARKNTSSSRSIIHFMDARSERCRSQVRKVSPRFRAVAHWGPLCSAQRHYRARTGGERPHRRDCFELVQGEGGIHPLTADYVRKARELADRHNVLLIFDEIQCGVGRPGTYFAYQLFDPVVLPDVMVAAKPLACGIPLGVIVANERAAAAIGAGMHGSTFGGGPLACRVALEFFDILEPLLPRSSRWARTSA